MYSLNSFSKSAGALIIAATLALSGCSSTASSSSNSPTGEVPKGQPGTQAQTVSAPISRSKAHVTRSGEVYLMRGLLDVFSRGMDTLAGRMRAKGFDAISYNHSNWLPLAEDIVARSKKKQVSYPIIIMGHSLGGNEAPKMANYLGSRGIKVDLVVAFDPTEHQVVGKNVGTVINYYLPNGRNTFDKSFGFKGSLQNVNVSHIPNIEHTNVEKNTDLQNKSIARAVKLTRKIKRKTARR
ncbi:MAG: hypothetical protein WBC71_03335 [Salaquimonas sp.]